jgi:hypothetical protein
MDSLTYTVIREIGDVKSQYTDSITAQCKNILSTMKVGDTIVAKDFIKKVMPNFSKTSRIKHLTNMGYRHLRCGKNIGMLSENEIARKSIEYTDFIHLKSLQYWSKQLSETKYKNTRPNRELVGTRDNYARLLWQFNEWLHGKSFSCYSSKEVGENLYECKYQDVTFDTVEDMLQLCKNKNSIKEDFIEIIKEYLYDDKNKKYKAGYMNSKFSAITSYFVSNECNINFKFKTKHMWDSENNQDTILFGLNEFADLIEKGGADLTERAVFLTKLHRGLDASTLSENFNFQAWGQMVEHFGEEDHKKWKIDSMCPVPIRLTRLKSDYYHLGFLEYDAVNAIINYLDFRESKMNEKMSADKPLFVNKFGNAINTVWVTNHFRDLAEIAGLLDMSSTNINNRDLGSHECRDLLKTIFESHKTFDKDSEHYLGHKGSSYSKKDIIYPQSLAENYIVISETLNIFSNVSSHRKSKNQSIKLQEELDEQKRINHQTIQQNQEIQRNVQLIMSYLKI